MEKLTKIREPQNEIIELGYTHCTCEVSARTVNGKVQSNSELLRTHLGALCFILRDK
jgi:hypothetical protein